jgi:hypothetical protein
MNRDAAAATFFARIFYGLVHAFVLLISFTYENDLKSECDAYSGSCFLFLLLKIFAVYLFFTFERHQSIVAHTIELPVVEWARPAQVDCLPCGITPSFRTKHCRKCEKCISVYDHHCVWIGCCVGELNHFRFFLYLFSEALCIWAVFWTAFSGLIEDSEGYGAFVVNISITGVFGTLLTCMGAFHGYLISINSTTWEVMSRHKISYFQPYPTNFNPFSEGIFQNWKKAACSNKVERWDLPQPMYIYPFNWCDNEYWSCC